MLIHNIVDCRYKTADETGKCIQLQKSDNTNYCKLPYMFLCTDACKEEPIKLSHSAIQNFMMCKYYYWIRNVQGVQLKDEYLSHAIKMGKAWDSIQSLFHGDAEALGFNAIVENTGLYPEEIAKLRAMYKGLQACVEPNNTNFLGTQKHFEITIDNFYSGMPLVIHGYYDKLYTTHFSECKFTSRPEAYNRPFLVNNQVGTYFLANKDMKYVDMEIAQVPQLRIGKKEDVSDFQERIYRDIISRPSNYFHGYNHEERSYGLRMWRREFDLDEILDRYKMIALEIIESAKLGSWWKNDKGCSAFYKPCDFMSICENSGSVSETMYDIRKKDMVEVEDAED